MNDVRHEEPPLERVAIYRGPQVPVLQAYVPLPVFGAECMALLLCMRVFGFWSLLMLPLHLVLVLRTNENPFWVRDVVAGYRHRWFVANRSRNAARAVVFSPHLHRREVQ
ncbi:hypothetical protein [Variovorax sp. E3]|uniref:hypothetical protein n=1 Tax=Variovorax sp. E3 TaxID=1914993 RepID=UPI0018DC45F9|nr:hypothetical protein [Variovorax sp. E3]